MHRARLILIISCLQATFAAAAVDGNTTASVETNSGTDYRQITRDIYAHLIQLRTTAALPENTRNALLATRNWLLEAGYPPEDVELVNPQEGSYALVARLRGQNPTEDTPSQQPVMLLAHMDVVDALRSDWAFEPFALREIDGFFYGRGTDDNKAGVTNILVNLIRLKREGYVPERDLIAVWTGDEETGSASINYLMNERRELVDAAFAINSDAGGGELFEGSPSTFKVQAAEKIYLTYHFTVTNPGGHSSRPRADNAIYDLTKALSQLAEYTFPEQISEIVRLYFTRSAPLHPGPLGDQMLAALDTPPDPEALAALSAEVPYYNAILRTTCVPTRLAAGHADNALPQTAQATVNCRILPGQNPDDLDRKLAQLVDNPKVQISRVNAPVPSDPSPLSDEILSTLEPIVEAMWPGVPLIPTMSAGATDGLYVRNVGIPVYGVSALFRDPHNSRAHGLNERVAVEALFDAQEFWYRMLKGLTSQVVPTS